MLLCLVVRIVCIMCITADILPQAQLLRTIVCSVSFRAHHIISCASSGYVGNCRCCEEAHGSCALPKGKAEERERQKHESTALLLVNTH